MLSLGRSLSALESESLWERESEPLRDPKADFTERSQERGLAGYSGEASLRGFAMPAATYRFR